VAKSAAKTVKKDAAQEATSKRTYVKQQDVPSASLDEALRLPQAVLDHYAGKPTSPLYLGKALNVDPRGSQLKVLSGAAIAFGLIEGGAQAALISVTELARRILRPTEENADLAAKREAVLRPRIFGEFLRNYDGHPFPRRDIALNVLEGMGIPRDKATEVFDRIEASALSVGLLEQIRDKKYVSLKGVEPARGTTAEKADAETEVVLTDTAETVAAVSRTIPSPEIITKGTALAAAIVDDQRRRRVFITHGQNRDLVDPVKKLLEFGELEPVVSVERQSVSKPVP
jgi:hypothetical protein